MARIKLKSATLQNFMSFGNKPITVYLDTSLVTLILGNNKDVGEEGYSRNGVGKTTVFQAICWCLFDEGLKSIKQDAFINLTNKNKMVVSLELEIDGIPYVITRGRKPNYVEMTRNGEPFTLHSTGTVDEAIQKLFGMNVDIFTNSVMLSNNINSFMNMKGAEQKAFIEKLLSLFLLSERAEYLKTEAKDNAVEVKLEEQNKTHIEEQTRRLLSNIGELKRKEKEWGDTRERTLNQLRTSLSSLEAIDLEDALNKIIQIEELDKRISNLRRGIQAFQQEESMEISDFKVIEQERLNALNNVVRIDKENIYRDRDSALVAISVEKEKDRANVEAKKKVHDEVKTEIRTQIALLKEVEKNIVLLEKEQKSLDSGECPYCHQSYTSEEKVHEVHDHLSQLKEHQKAISDEINSLDAKEVAAGNEYKSADEEFKTKYSTKENEIRKLFDERVASVNATLEEGKRRYHQELTDDISAVKQKHETNIKMLEQAIAKSEETRPVCTYTKEQCVKVLNDIERTKERITEAEANVINPYSEQIVVLEKDVKQYDPARLNDLKKKDEHYKILVKMLTDSKSFVRKNLIDQYVPYINQKINGYLEQLDSPHKVRINNDLSVDIEYMRQTISYGNLSGGEQLRVNIAVSMAFREFLEVSGTQINVLMIDELLDNGLDSAGFYKVFKMLKKQDKSVFIISHREELIPEVDRVMTVVKEGGFSSIHYSS
jgi:DNA repair exonuclease SbcCD ATPase subunit